MYSLSVFCFVKLSRGHIKSELIVWIAKVTDKIPCYTPETEKDVSRKILVCFWEFIIVSLTPWKISVGSESEYKKKKYILLSVDR